MERESETLRTPPSLNAICRGGSPLPSSPAPGAYAPLAGAGCGVPLEMIVEMVVVEVVAELLAEMAVEVVLPVLLPPRSRSAVVLAAPSRHALRSISRAKLPVLRRELLAGRNYQYYEGRSYLPGETSLATGK